MTEHHLVFSLLVEILFWWWTCASLTDYKGGGLKNSLISRQFLFLFFLISLVPYYDTNQCFRVHWTSIPKFTTPTKKIQFLAFLLWNWMMRLLYSQHISDKIGWPASIQSFSYSVRFLSVKQTIPNRNRWVQTPKSQGMTPLKLEIWEGDSTRVNLIVMVRLANVTVTSTTLVRLTSCWGCQLWYQSKFESVWHQFSPKTFN